MMVASSGNNENGLFGSCIMTIDNSELSRQITWDEIIDIDVLVTGVGLVLVSDNTCVFLTDSPVDVSDSYIYTYSQDFE